MSTYQEFADREATRLREWERRVEGMVRSKGGNASAKEFQAVVNQVFHDVEAASYDKLHREMWDSLGIVFDQLANDALTALPAAKRLTLVDVGCGTGLATDFVLRTPLKERIERVVLVDTSQEMLERSKLRSANWPVTAEFLHGEVALVPDNSADILVVSSVLHHLTDLIGFCQQVQRVLRPHGVFLHLQDPKFGAASSSEYQKRRNEFLTHTEKKKTSLKFRLKRFARQTLAKLLPSSNQEYLQEVNRRLIQSGIISKSLSPQEIWSITDLREGDMPLSTIDGICPDELAMALNGFELIALRPYSFFGIMPSHLPKHLQEEERRLFEAHCQDGLRLAGAWRRQ